MVLESLVEPLLANHEVINEGIVGCGGLIRAAPTAVDQVKLTTFDKLFCLFLDLRCLVFVPHFEELGLSISECPGVVLDKLLVN